MTRMKEYDLDNYDNEEEVAKSMLVIGDLTVFSDPAKVAQFNWYKKTKCSGMQHRH